MIGGLRNLAYVSWGTRAYGEKPVLPRLRERWEFQFIFEGRALPTEVTFPEMTEEKPRLYVSHPKSPHGWTDGKGAISDIFVVQYKEIPDELDGRLEPERPVVVDLDGATVERMRRRCEEAKRAMAAGDVQASLFFQRLLMELTTLAIGRGEERVNTVDAEDKIARAMNWFEENVAGMPTVAEASKAAGVSAAHLRRLFAEAGRPSPQAELSRLRMEAAKRCLRDGWTQKAVAEFLGFSEPSAFARAFRDHEGVAPGGWLKKGRRALGA